MFSFLVFFVVFLFYFILVFTALFPLICWGIHHTAQRSTIVLFLPWVIRSLLILFPNIHRWLQGLMHEGDDLRNG